MKNLKHLLLLLLLLLTVGCAKKPVIDQTACPPFPDPTNAAVDKIQSLNDPEVNDWIIRLYRLKQQLKVK